MHFKNVEVSNFNGFKNQTNETAAKYGITKLVQNKVN
jgi:hypothetical protein